MLKFSLKQLEIFVTVAELNSFTNAAKALYLTQSTVSAHISGLESALNTRLFSRDARRSVTLTAQGQRLYPAAKRILSDCRELTSLVENRHEELPLLLGASTVPGQYLLPELLASFLRRRPDCRYLLRRGDSQQIHELLRAGSVRIGFVGARLDPARLRYTPILEADGSVAYIPSDWLESARSFTPWDGYAGNNCTLFLDGDLYQKAEKSIYTNQALKVLWDTGKISLVQVENDPCFAASSSLRETPLVIAPAPDSGSSGGGGGSSDLWTPPVL